MLSYCGANSEACSYKYLGYSNFGNYVSSPPLFGECGILEIHEEIPASALLFQNKCDQACKNRACGHKLHHLSVMEQNICFL